jgi:MFS family permease
LTLYPVVNYLVKERYFGTAYGIIESCCNVGSLAGSLLIGFILNTHTHAFESESENIRQYNTVHLILLLTALISIVFAIILNIYDTRKGGKNVMNTVITFEEKGGSSNSGAGDSFGSDLDDVDDLLMLDS